MRPGLVFVTVPIVIKQIGASLSARLNRLLSLGFCRALPLDSPDPNPRA